MNPAINDLATDVGELYALDQEARQIARRKAEIVARLRARVTPDNVDAFRTQYGSIVTPARVAPKVDAMQLSEYSQVCRELDVWPLRAEVRPYASKGTVLDLVAMTYRDDVATSRCEVSIPTTRILTDLREGRFVYDLSAVPPPLVADRMRERGDLPPADYRIDFRCRAMDALAEGGDDDTA